MILRNKKYDAQADNLHREYGIISNSIWILKKIKKYKPGLLWLMVIGAFTSSFMQYLWSFIGKFIIDIVKHQREVLDKSIKPLVILLCITTILELISMGLNTYTSGKRWYSFIYVRFKLILEKISKSLSMNFEKLEDPKVLDLMEKAGQATSGNSNGCEGMMYALYDFMFQFMLIAVTLITISTFSIMLVLLIFVISVMQYIFFAYTVKKDKKNVWNKMAPVWRKLNYMNQITQDFSFAKDIRLFGMKKWLSKKQSEVNKEKYRCFALNKNYWSYNSIYSHMLTCIRNIVTYGCLIYSVVFGSLSIGDFVLFLGIAGTLSRGLTNFFNSIGHYKECSMQVDDFRTFIDTPSNEDKENTIPIPKSDKYTLTFENVSFKYKGQNNYAIKDLNITLEHGKSLAIVGLNGAGKTTFIKLLLRLYDVTEGRILLNGIDIRKFDRMEYYTLFSPVFQNIEIFAFPMSENVSMRIPKDTNCDKAEKCLRMVGMGDKIDSLINGVHTELLKIIYDDGVNLSGGEKQKLALARALYKDAPIIVLDEPTSAQDAIAEYNLYKNFNTINKGKNIVYISHRLSSTRFCDNIALFESGKILEYGTHDELIARKGKYAELFEVQSQYYKNK